MDFNKFAQDKDDCHVSEGGFLLWKITGQTSFVPSFFDGEGGNIVAHVLVYAGELQARHAGCMHVLPQGSFSSFMDFPLFQLISASSDVVAYVMVIRDAYAKALLRNNPPVPFSYVLELRTNPVKRPDAGTINLFRHRMENIREACLDTGNLFRDKMIKCAIWMLLMDIADKHIREGGGHKDRTDKTDRTMKLFIGFMKLLPEHAPSEHFAGFYATRLCVTTQYLNRVVKSVSGRTVSGWINFTLTGEITKRLEGTDDTMQKIAEELNFPDSATLTKFYKRETGYSLTEYKKKITS